MDHNFKLTIEYDGTNYHGWQRQPNGCSIQQTIEAAIAVMTRQKISLTGSGRTDAGVHALGQVANFKCRTPITPEAFQKGLNSLLPDDIVIRECALVSLDFHARYRAKAKVYRYYIRNQNLPSAIGRQYAWWIRAELDIAAMHAALGYIVGEHDFKSFEGAGSPRSHTIRHVTRAELICKEPGNLALEIEADGFLRYMVRNITGTLVDVGTGKINRHQVKEILFARDRNLAGATAPAHGLFLINVRY
jgi:tRNA pseudouridine38-40 synthase